MPMKWKPDKAPGKKREQQQRLERIQPIIQLNIRRRNKSFYNNWGFKDEIMRKGIKVFDLMR